MLRFLAIDDDPLDQDMIRMSILRSGISIELTPVLEAMDAMELLVGNSDKWDLVLLDSKMSPMSGLKFLELYSNAVAAPVPTVLLTGHLGSSERLAPMAFSFVKECLEKPLGADDVQDLAMLCEQLHFPT